MLTDPFEKNEAMSVPVHIQSHAPGPVRVYFGRKIRSEPFSTVPSPIQYQEASEGVTNAVGAAVVPPWIVRTSWLPRWMIRSLLMSGALPGLLPSALTVPRNVSEKFHATAP